MHAWDKGVSIVIYQAFTTSLKVRHLSGSAFCFRSRSFCVSGDILCFLAWWTKKKKYVHKTVVPRITLRNS